MRKYLTLILIGLFFALPGEALISLVLTRGSAVWPALLKDVLVYTVFLSLAWLVLARLFKRYSKFNATVASFFIIGLIGLAIEWTLLGNSPWQNPEASSLGMFTFWASLVMAPLILTDKGLSQNFRRTLWIYFGSLSILFLVLGLSSNSDLRFLGLIIWIYGTIALNIFYFKYFWLLKKSPLSSTRNDAAL